MDIDRSMKYTLIQSIMIEKYKAIKKSFPEGHRLRVNLSKHQDKPKKYIRWCKEHLGVEMDRWAYYKKAIIFKNIEDKIYFVLSCMG